MVVTAAMVKILRDKTGAGMLDCKKALEATKGNIDEAITYLRERGIAQAAKKADRIAAEGLTNVVVNGNEAVIYEVNSETDFAAKNKQFTDLVELIGNILIGSKVTNTNDALKLKHDGKEVSFILAEATAVIGEKITLRRVARVIKKSDQDFGSYLHMGGKIASLVVLSNHHEEVAKDVAMHIAAINPLYLDRSHVDQEVLEKEKSILTQQALAEGKPANIVEKMIVGRLNKFLQDVCLVDQTFIKNPDQKISQFLKANNTSVISFIRLEVGEGIAKKEEDFAAEVAAQTRK